MLLWEGYRMRLSEGIATNSDYVDFLNVFSEYNYNEKNEDFVFDFILSDNQLDRIKKIYDYKNCINENSFKTMVRLMVWVFDQLLGDGMCIPPSRFNTEIVLDLTKSKNLYSNCYMYATVLNEIYLSMGFFSRMVRCMPIDLSYNDCHCVVEAFCQEYNKWIIFDAANKAYYVNKSMIPLNLFELRETIRNNQPVIVPMMSRSETSKLIEYWTRNLIRFESYKVSRYGNESCFDNRTMLHFQSKNYPISDKEVYYSDYDFYIKHIHTSNPNLFWKLPVSSINARL